MRAGRTGTLNPLADGELDRRWLQGETEALEEANRRYRTRLEGVAYRILGNRADAEDVVQRVFMALPRATYRGTASLWSYLYRASVNGAVNLIRARQRRQAAHERLYTRAQLESAPAGPEGRVLEGEMMAAVARALLQVKPQHRRVLVLRIHHGMTNTEIAEQENLPLPTVGTWLRRGREELRHALRPMLEEFERQKS